ncbi:DIS3-like exonuclease 2 [Balamuthia mandrillaris]
MNPDPRQRISSWFSDDLSEAQPVVAGGGGGAPHYGGPHHHEPASFGQRGGRGGARGGASRGGRGGRGGGSRGGRRGGSGGRGGGGGFALVPDRDEPPFGGLSSSVPSSFSPSSSSSSPFAAGPAKKFNKSRKQQRKRNEGEGDEEEEEELEVSSPPEERKNRGKPNAKADAGRTRSRSLGKPAAAAAGGNNSNEDENKTNNKSKKKITTTTTTTTTVLKAKGVVRAKRNKKGEAAKGDEDAAATRPQKEDRQRQKNKRQGRGGATEEGRARRKRKSRFEQHLSPEEVEKGLADGSLHKGLLRVNPHRTRLAYVTAEGFERDILLEGIHARNRAFDGDTVVVRILETRKEGGDSKASSSSASGKRKQEEPKEKAKESTEETQQPHQEDDSQSEGEELLLGRRSRIEREEDDKLVDQSIQLHDYSAAEERAEEQDRAIRGDEDDEMFSELRKEIEQNLDDESDHPDDDRAPEAKVSISEKEDEDEEEDEDDEVDEDAAVESEDEEAEEEPGQEKGEEAPRSVGKVVAILESKHAVQMVGYLKPCGDGDEELGVDNYLAFFVPLEKKMPRVLVPVKNLPPGFLKARSDLTDNLFVGIIERWEITDSHPKGKLLRNLGKAGDTEVEMRALLEEAEIYWTEDFPEDALACLHSKLRRLEESRQYEEGAVSNDKVEQKEEGAKPKPQEQEWENFEISAAEVARRRDLRDTCVFSIDPATARDLDDALSITPLSPSEDASGHQCYEVGVHIADVTFFVEPDTALDKEARKRATTVYLVHRNIPMLPRILCDNMCSLVPGVDRVTFSVMWKMNEEGVIQGEPWFGKTIIRSSAKLDYDTAQEMLLGNFHEEDYVQPHDPQQQKTKEEGEEAEQTSAKKHPFFKWDNQSKYTLQDINKDVQILHKMATHMRHRRYQEGSMNIDTKEMAFELDENGRPVSTRAYVQKESNWLIEEFMLQANRSVAEKIYQVFPNASLLRRHAPPQERKLKEFLDMCKSLNIAMDASSTTSFEASMQEIRNMANSDIALVISALALKPMSTAKYTATNPDLELAYYRHYALAFDLYTHFTSPIRRYPDVVVHRILHAYLQHQDAPFGQEELEEIATNCNERKHKADKAQEKCDLVFLCMLLQDNPENEEDAIVLETSAKTFTVLVLRYGFDDKVFVEDIPAESTQHREEEQSHLITWPDGTTTLIKPFSRIKVRLVPDLKKKPIDVRIRLLPPGGAELMKEFEEKMKEKKRQKEEEGGEGGEEKRKGQRGGGGKKRGNGERDQATRQRVEQTIEEFMRDNTAETYSFPANLSSFERLVVYETAERKGLSHFTQGKRFQRERTIVVSKVSNKKKVDNREGGREGRGRGGGKPGQARKQQPQREGSESDDSEEEEETEEEETKEQKGKKKNGPPRRRPKRGGQKKRSEEEEEDGESHPHKKVTTQKKQKAQQYRLKDKHKVAKANKPASAVNGEANHQQP